MKRIIFFILLINLLYFPISAKALATNSSYDNIKVYFFSDNDCKDCNKAKEWLEDTLKDDKRIRKEYIDVSENKDLYDEIRDVLNIKKDNLPLIVIGSNYFTGFTEKNKTSFKEAVSAYEDAKDYCNLVSKVQYDEDIKECLTQNDNIYENPTTEISVGMIIIVVVVSIALLSGAIILILLLRKKNRKRLRK